MDLIERQAAVDALNKLDVSDGVGISSIACSVQESAISAIQHLPSVDTYLSGFSDKLWKTAYERGKAEAVRWISVSEKLPEDLVSVLVDDDGTTEIGYCEHYLDDDGKTCVEWHDLLYYRIEPHYWMPLPEPYKDDGQ